jgi:hypothetical protein
MTVGTTTLNVGSGGDKVLKDSLDTVNGAPAPADAVIQVVKLAHGKEGIAELVDSTDPLPVGDQELRQLLTRLVSLQQAPPGYDKAIGRYRESVVLESGTVTTVTTVTTVVGLTNIDGRNGSMLINQTNLSAWADCVRARIT